MGAFTVVGTKKGVKIPMKVAETKNMLCGAV